MIAQNARVKRKLPETFWGKRPRADRGLRNHTAKKGLALALMLVTCMTLAGAFAAVEYTVSSAIPHIDPTGANIQSRIIESEEDAIAYAKLLWASDFLRQDTSGLTWSAHEDTGVYYVTAGEEASQLAVHFGHDGVVTYLYNGISRFSDARISPDAYISDPDALCMYLLDFVDALSPGASDRIESFRSQQEVSIWQDHTFATFAGYVFSEKGKEHDTYSLFTVEVLPQIRIVNYAVGIPMSVLDSGVG